LARSRKLADRLRKILQPIREAAGRFVILPPDQHSAMGKAVSFLVSERIPGDYLEFGVFKGNSLAAAYRLFAETYEKEIAHARKHRPDDANRLEKHWADMRFVGFDSFAGLPELRGLDALTDDFRQGQFACSEDDFWRNLETKGVDLSKVVCVPGWFEETLVSATRQKLGLEKAALIHIDSDLYRSAKLALDFVTPLLQDGTIILFDDWFNYRGHPNLGERRALREWAEAHPEWLLTEYQKEGVRKNSFIVNAASIGTDHSDVG
jgi:O-methyltransferase